MNFNPKPTPEPKKNNNRLILGIILMAALIVFVVIGALYLASGMNHVVYQFSNVKEPVSVIGAMSNP